MIKIVTRRNTWSRIALVAVAFGVAPAVFAGGTTNMTVTATILATCKVITAPAALAFGSIDPSGLVNVTATTTFTTKCTNGTTESASTDNGGANFSAGTKRMQTTAPVGHFLPYAVAYSGDTTFTGTGFAAGAGNTVTVTGTITPAQFQTAVANTTYTDTVVITVAP
jgi:spore coat protein U-like protein